MTEHQDDKAVLYTHFGTHSPYWRLAGDSDAIELAAVKGATNIAMALRPEQADSIRSLTGITSSLRIDVTLYGDPIRLHLVGRKIGPNEWAGTASALADTESVAKDLVEGLSFAETVVSEANSVIVIVDQHGRVQRFNKLSEEYTGKREQDIVGRSVFEMFMTREEAAASRRNIAAFYRHGHSYEVERLINTVKGPRLFLFRNKFVTSGSGEKRVYLICSGTDITEERQAQERLRVLANTDMLTDLPNRHAITERLKRALSAGGGGRGGVLFLDLDNFKRVNDHYGHGFGDHLLKTVSVAISSCLSEGQTLARLGGDEFIVLQEHAQVWELEATAQRIIERLREPFRQGLIEVYTSCSIGIAMYPDHGADLDSVVRSADIAMYVAKEAGRHTYRVFQPDMDRRNADYVWLDTNLRKALAENHLMLYYQPKLASRTGEVDGVEALVRWRSPERGLIGPDVFIPYAEESGLISQLGVWVMREAARQAAEWRRQGLDIRIAINMSARQLDDKGVVSDFMRAISDAGGECMLDIELTESCLVEDEDAAIGLIKQFRQLGARVHMDDFGTGYSSLSQLARLPLDAIKLDASFVRGVNENPVSQALARAIVAVARTLELKVIAEGVETHEETAFLDTLGVDAKQGYLYAKPMPGPEFTAWLNRRSRLHLIA
ncbi:MULTISPECIES: cyclic di-GMP phosphodiesterase [unclassified Achromobacter]|uniref:cyclic di-GMP phosphodiesterase n=1 Tax=unclassified Achromobacter TaxID=2626865 RepID=UPI00069D53AB|nr:MULTISPECIES: cyclic di-GMP phosphodiesterase [unclassified Achromobacter]KOF52509.1 RNase II stability modulator [Achromobacter sp. DMS1]KOF52589.1 RNase II stability modulator [Achromobacter sp. DMS1]KOF54112.1 RNase II stability modulator [Achromobacter sp. DMS1]